MKKISKIMTSVLAPIVVLSPIVTLASCNTKDTTKLDQAKIDEINGYIKDQNFSTMYELCTFLLINHGIDLETMDVLESGDQIVWDCKENIVFTITRSGELSTIPTGSDYKLNTNLQNVWKIVFYNGNNGKSNDYQRQEYKKECPFGQYIQRDALTDSIDASSSVDVGFNENIKVNFSEAKVLKTKAKVVTNKCILHITNSVADVDHYGRATRLQIDAMAENSSYNEYGTVDGDAILKSCNFVAQPSSEINDIIVKDSQTKIKVESDGKQTAKIGVVTPSKDSGITDLTKQIEYGKKVKEEEKPTIDPAPHPVPTEDEFGGLGTAESPYTIFNSNLLYKCAEVVNKAGGATIWHFKLTSNIDCSDQEKNFTPIGNASTIPFKGTFDGNGYVISNITIKNNVVEGSKSDVSYHGLFGCTDGEANTEYTDHTKIWDDEKNELIEDYISEDKYQTVIKNILIENISVENDSCKFTGGIAGRAYNTFISGCQILTGKISGLKTVGGITGALDASICRDCNVGSTLLSDALDIYAVNYGLGGIVGNTSYTATNQCDAIINCTVWDNVQIEASYSNGGSIGGIVGAAQNSKSFVASQCINYANIKTWTGNSAVVGVAGICGDSKGVYAIDHCTNYGNIEVERNDSYPNSSTNYMAGIATNGGGIFINCYNHGKLKGYCNSGMSGIFCGFVSCKYHPNPEVQIISCANMADKSKDFTSLNTDIIPTDLCSSSSQITIMNQTFENVEKLNEALSTYHSSATASSIVFKDCTVKDNSGTLNINSQTTSSIVSNKQICSNVNVKNLTNITLSIPNMTLTVDEETNASITNIGENSHIVITENGKVNSAIVAGENATITNKGIVLNTIGIDGASKSGINYGTCSKVTFHNHTTSVTGTGSKTFTNETTGKIITNSTDTGHTIYCHYAPFDIEIHNKGYIEHSSSESGYIACLYPKENLVVPKLYCYEGSVLKNNANYFFAVDKTPGLEIYYKPGDEGAKIYLGDTEKSFESFATPTGSITVNTF